MSSEQRKVDRDGSSVRGRPSDVGNDAFRRKDVKFVVTVTVGGVREIREYRCDLRIPKRPAPEMGCWADVKFPEAAVRTLTSGPAVDDVSFAASLGNVTGGAALEVKPKVFNDWFQALILGGLAFYSIVKMATELWASGT